MILLVSFVIKHAKLVSLGLQDSVISAILWHFENSAPNRNGMLCPLENNGTKHLCFQGWTNNLKWINSILQEANISSLTKYSFDGIDMIYFNGGFVCVDILYIYTYTSIILWYTWREKHCVHIYFLKLMGSPFTFQKDNVHGRLLGRSRAIPFVLERRCLWRSIKIQ